MVAQSWWRVAARTARQVCGGVGRAYVYAWAGSASSADRASLEPASMPARVPLEVFLRVIARREFLGASVLKTLASCKNAALARQARIPLEVLQEQHQESTISAALSRSQKFPAQKPCKNTKNTLQSPRARCRKRRRREQPWAASSPHWPSPCPSSCSPSTTTSSKDETWCGWKRKRASASQPSTSRHL